MRKILLIVLLVPFAASAASVYKCELDGRVQFQDRACPGSRPDENLVEIRAFRLLNSGTPAPTPVAAVADAKAPVVETAKAEMTQTAKAELAQSSH